MYVNLLNALALRQFQQPVNVLDVTVHTAIGHQSHKMQAGIVSLHILAGGKKSFILKEISILDSLGDLSQVLINDPAGSHIQMSHLRVSHLSFRKSYRHPAGVAFYKRILLHQLVHHRRLRLSHRIAFFTLIQSVSVQDH